MNNLESAMTFLFQSMVAKDSTGFDPWDRHAIGTEDHYLWHDEFFDTWTYDEFKLHAKCMARAIRRNYHYDMEPINRNARTGGGNSDAVNATGSNDTSGLGNGTERRNGNDGGDSNPQGP